MNNLFPDDAYGITSTIPLEVLLAAGKKVVDLNNLFISDSNPKRFIQKAEAAGFPRTCCAWIKGIFGLIISLNIKNAVFVTGGDCSNTHAMMEVLSPMMKEIHTFSFPFERDVNALDAEISRFSARFNVSRADIGESSERLNNTRKLLIQLDEQTWKTGRISGFENHFWQVSASDFMGDPESFKIKLSDFLKSVEKRPEARCGPRLGILGVPNIFSDLFGIIESLGGNVVFNEIPRQFTIPYIEKSICEKYLAYTYPFGVEARITDIRREIQRRKLDGLIHYTQAFCHRQIHDIALRRNIELPILTIEGENPGPVDARTKLRIESFLEILKERTEKDEMHATR